MLGAQHTRSFLRRTALGVDIRCLAETQNRCERRTAESCILPIRGSGVRVDLERLTFPSGSTT